MIGRRLLRGRRRGAFGATIAPWYGSARGDSRDNTQVGGAASQKVAYRFVAEATSTAETIRVAQRGGSGYSGGTGGEITCQIQTATSSGLPSGTSLAELSWEPGNPGGAWEVWTEYTFPSPATLSRGQQYFLVFTNTDSAPATNFISLNNIFYYGTADSPRQPCISDDYAVYVAAPTTWTLTTNESPTLDLGYANGAHQGLAYTGAAVSNSFIIISGASSMARQTMTVTDSSRTTYGCGVVVKRISGTDDLSIRLEDGAGNEIETQQVIYSSIATGLYPNVNDEAHLGGNSWAVVTWSTPRVLSLGSSYRLRLSCPSSSEYVANPTQELSVQGMTSQYFKDGRAEETLNGSTWEPPYAFEDVAKQDLQFYFKLTP